MYSPDRNYRHNAENIWTDDAAALIAIVEHYKNRPKNSSVLMTLFHGRQRGSHRKDACYSSMGKHFLSSHLFWKKPEEDDINNRWYAEFNKILQAYTTSHYVNQIDNGLHPDRVRASFSEENWQQLARLRKKYDPDNRFHTYLGLE